jgi:RNA polymerase sigma factor (sigma-70 family)
MANTQAKLVLRHIRDLVGIESTSPLSDQQLLQRFGAQRDQAAFEALVRRHGSLVAGVCRRVLGNLHDAEDAFQATFLVLARKAASIRQSESVGGWLYRVAYHVAVQARARASSRQRHEQQAGKSLVVDPLTEVTGRELVSILDEELQRLPERYQAPLVLCHLEGHTRDEAAQRLGWSLGTFKRRLEQARAILRGRLARRGLTLAAALTAAGIGQSAPASVLPAVFIASTVRGVLRACQSGGGVSESVTTLADGALKALLLPQPRFVAAGILLLAGAMALGLGLFTRPASAGRQPGDTAALTSELPDGKEGAKNEPVKPVDRKELSVSGRVLDADGKPVAKADVALVGGIKSPLRGERELRWPKFLAQARTDAEGRFRLTIPGRSRAAFWARSVVARAPGHALGQAHLEQEGKQGEVTVRLNREQAVHGRLVDLQGQPAAGVKVHVVAVSSRLSPKQLLGADLHEPPKDQPAWPAPVTTDAQGRFVLHGLRPDWDITIAVRDERLAQQELTLKAQDKGKAEEVTLALAPVRFVEGTVTYEDTGKPVKGARVMVLAAKEPFGSIPRESYWRTDAKGHFRALPHMGNYYRVIAYPPAGEPYLMHRREFPWPKTAVVKHAVHLKLVRGVVIRGTVTDASSGKPIAGAPVHFEPSYDNNPFYRNDVHPFFRSWEPNLLSGPDGKFALTVLPGPGQLLVNGPTLDYLHTEILSNKLYGMSVHPQRRHYADGIVELNSKPGIDPPPVAVELRRGVTVSGQLLTPEGKDVASAQLLCQSHIPYGHDLHQVMPLPAGKGKFELPGYDPDHPLPVYFLDAEHQLGAMVKFSAKDASGKAVVKLQPCGSATARFLDAKGKPLANLLTFVDMALNEGASSFDEQTTEKIVADVGSQENLDPRRYGQLRTDAQGRITWPTLIPGARFFVIVRTPKGRDVIAHKGFRVEAGKTRDLKEITVKEPPE